MEAHHPHHVMHKKKWNEYLLEFFMLFLAVFLGFVAENIRERKTETKVEEQLIYSLVDDLKADTLAFNANADFWIERVKQIDSLRSYIQPAEKNYSTADAYYWAAGSFSFTDFRYHNGTIQQLRNTGNFRLLEKRKVVDTLIAYDGSVTSYYFNVEKTARDEYALIRHLQSSIFNSYYLDKFYNAYTILFDNTYTTLTPRSVAGDKLLNISNDSLMLKGTTDSHFEFYNELYNYERLARALIFLDNSLKEEAVKLITLIRKEYNLP